MKSEGIDQSKLQEDPFISSLSSITTDGSLVSESLTDQLNRLEELYLQYQQMIRHDEMVVAEVRRNVASLKKENKLFYRRLVDIKNRDYQHEIQSELIKGNLEVLKLNNSKMQSEVKRGIVKNRKGEAANRRLKEDMDKIKEELNMKFHEKKQEMLHRIRRLGSDE